MGVEWTWFVVQHYFLYAEILNQVLNRIHLEPNVGSETLEALARVFHQVHSDPVVAILHACQAVGFILANR